MFIYVIVCNESLKLYVGQHKKEDLGKYLSQKFFDANRYSGKRSHLYAAMRKHPRESWSIHPVISGIEDKKELDELEKHFIRVLKTQHSDVGYNICDGGEGRTGPHSEEARRKMSEKVQAYYDSGGQAGMKGKTHTAEWKQFASERGRKYRATEETKQKMSISLKGHSVSDSVRNHARELGRTLVGEKNPFFGKHHSEKALRLNAEAHRGIKQSSETIEKRAVKLRNPSVETREKIAQALRGRVVSFETRAKIGAKHKGKKVSEDARRKMSDARKAYWVTKRESC